MTRYETLSIIAQLLILIVTAAYACFAYGQLRAIRDTLDVTQHQRRPWIIVTPDNPEGWPSARAPPFLFSIRMVGSKCRGKPRVPDAIVV